MGARRGSHSQVGLRTLLGSDQHTPPIPTTSLGYLSSLYDTYSGDRRMLTLTSALVLRLEPGDCTFRGGPAGGVRTRLN